METDALLPSSPAEPGYALPLQTVQIQISWLLKKSTDLDLHCLSFSMYLFVLRFYSPVNPMGLGQWKGEKERRKYFMIKSPWKNVANLAGVKPTTSCIQYVNLYQNPG